MIFKYLFRGLIIISLVSCSTQQPLQQADKDSSETSAVGADTSSVEWVEVYFNMPADKAVALIGNEANDKADLLNTLIRLINSAKYSVDLSIYNLENHEVGDALVRAADRGVRVRVVTDHYNRFRDRELGKAMWNMLAGAGIYSIDDAGEIYKPDGTVESANRLPGASYDMHNKFAVIDYMSENPDDYYVWTGSMNLTYTGPHNSNNTIVIKDSGIAGAYYSEFTQMWGSEGDIPNAENARFHKDKESRMYGFDLFTPESRYGSFQAYVQAKDREGNIIDVNKKLLKNGFGEWSRFYRQHPDSIEAFKSYTEFAKDNELGMWKNPERVGERIARVELGGEMLCL